MKKFFLIGILLVVAAIGLGTWFFLSNLDALVADAIEKHGSEVTSTRVAVSGVSIQLREGRGSISGLEIDSPEGFGVRQAFSLDDITIDLDVGSVRDDPVVIDEILIRAPVIRAEFNAEGVSNIDVLRERAEEHSAGQESGGDEAQAGGEAKRLRIKHFVFEEGRVEVDASALGVEKQELDFPRLELHDLGGADGGTPDQIAKQALTAVTRQVAETLARSQAEKFIRENLDESLVDEAKGLLDKIRN